MFHVKRSLEAGRDPQAPSEAYRSSKSMTRFAAIGLLVLFATFAIGCSKARSSRGWAAPVKTDSYLMVSAGKGRLDGLDPSTHEEKWRFPKSWQLDDSEARNLTGIYGDPVVAKDGTVYLGD